ncbi:MAG: hypothetical protein ABH810_03395 [bacterium]
MINKSLLTSEKPLKVKLSKISENQAKITFSDHQSVEINVKYLPKNSKEGDELYFNLVSEDEFTLTKKEIAKQLLEDILNKDEL